jgi:hypothetical protein
MSFIMNLLYTIAISTTGAFAYYITKKKYSIKVQHFETKVAWYGLKTYCIIEDKVNLLLNKYKSFQPEKPKQNYIALINNEGKEIIRHTESEFQIIKKDLKKGLDYELIVYEVNINNNNNNNDDEKVKSNKSNKSKYEKNILLFEDHHKVCLSENLKINNKVHFLSIYLKIFTDDSYNIKLNFGNDNYYLVGNKLFNRVYLNWFLNNKHDDIIMKYPFKNKNNKFQIKEDTKYSIILIDQNIKCIEMNNKQYIMIKDNEYVICYNEVEDN